MIFKNQVSAKFWQTYFLIFILCYKSLKPSWVTIYSLHYLDVFITGDLILTYIMLRAAQLSDFNKLT